MRRRRLLALTAAGLAGCTGPVGSGTETTPRTGTDESRNGDTTDTATDPQTTTAAGFDPVTVEPSALQPGLVTLTAPDAIGVTHAENCQYLYLHARVDGTGPPRDRFSFRLDGSEYDPLTGEDRQLYRELSNSEPPLYPGSDGSGLLFGLPEAVADASDARLSWPGGEWQPGPGLRERLSSPEPAFDVSVSIPETVEVGTQPTLSFTAENTGSVAGRVLLAVNRVGPRIAHAPVTMFSRRVPAGDRQSWEWTDESVRADADAISLTAEDGGFTSMRYLVEWDGGDTSGEISITG
jgi:hypothetical protein